MLVPRFARFVLVAWSLFCSAVSVQAAETKKWNIIAIVTDDQGVWSLGCYGNKESRTPNMDRLAREGARFQNAFTPTPVCSPRRASMLCGLYGTQVGITDWVYEEEFHCRDGWRWSPDGEKVAYWQIDTGGVKTFTLIDTTTASYPILKTFAYPKAGERNSACKVGVV